ncbi:hypothetical protein HYH03_016864 [Edaphochlamys debaryana]|uniref:Mitochondrial inner membrane protease subunit 1 n=1 Tax=Edaphochlamys debaryana TaxID=47281 RepID=A0A835XGQ7_9CHLO|nr:hypothetical protein HYH03_016864 [Edaphochlamys debaryana]|eukprot:KAG2484322.1 hypothetical protein HYH03_016864 [Edaphochlamys debaryana]
MRSPQGLLMARYRLAKLVDAAEEFLAFAWAADKQQSWWQHSPGAGGLGSLAARPGLPLSALIRTRAVRAAEAAGQARLHKDGGMLGVLGEAYRHAREVYDAPVTQHMYLTGPAMAPTLNPKGVKDPAARVRLVLRILRRPGPRNVMVGDVVAFHSPLAVEEDDTHIMVRRVAAVEGQEMVSITDDDQPYYIPAGHLWVLADNANLRVEDGEVIDSRSYGHIPYKSVIGRVVYACASRAHHGPVRNNPGQTGEDEAVVAAEVDVEEMLEDEEGEGGSDVEGEGTVEGDTQAGQEEGGVVGEEGLRRQEREEEERRRGKGGDGEGRGHDTQGHGSGPHGLGQDHGRDRHPGDKRPPPS